MPNGSGGGDCGHCVFNDVNLDPENWDSDKNYCALRKFTPPIPLGYTVCDNFIPGEFETRPPDLPAARGPIYAILYGDEGYFSVPWIGLSGPDDATCVSCEVCKGASDCGIKIELEGKPHLFCSEACYIGWDSEG